MLRLKRLRFLLLERGERGGFLLFRSAVLHEHVVAVLRGEYFVLLFLVFVGGGLGLCLLLRLRLLEVGERLLALRDGLFVLRDLLFLLVERIARTDYAAPSLNGGCVLAHVNRLLPGIDRAGALVHVLGLGTEVGGLLQLLPLLLLESLDLGVQRRNLAFGLLAEGVACLAIGLADVPPV